MTRSTSARLAHIARVLGILAVAALVLAGSDVARAQQPVPAPGPAPTPQSGALRPPRTLTVTLYMSAVDNELGNNVPGDSSQQKTINFERWGESQTIEFDRLCVGDEVKVTVPMTAIADSTGAITVQGSAKLWEGDDCDTTDLEDTETFAFTVRPGEREHEKKELANEGVGGGDTGTAEITAVNGPFVGRVAAPLPAPVNPGARAPAPPATGPVITCSRHPLSTHLICPMRPTPGSTLVISWPVDETVTVRVSSADNEKVTFVVLTSSAEGISPGDIITLNWSFAFP